MNSCIIVLLALLSAACTGPGEYSFKHQTSDSLDSLIGIRNKDDRFHGTIVVGNQDTILYEKATGVANRVWNNPVTMSTRFDIASLAKSFYAALILIAVEEGRLSLDGRLTDLLNDFGYSGNFNEQITLHHMLTHTSGIPDYDAVSPELSANDFTSFKRMHPTNSEYIEFISKLPPVGDPGQQFHYSNFAYHLIAIILEETYNQSFGEILESKICHPLGMDDTYSTTSNEAVYPDVAEGYRYMEEEGRWRRNNFIDLTLGRRIFSTARDLWLWGRAMNDNHLLNDSSLSLIKTNHLEGDVSYGYGWAVFDGRKNYRMGNLSLDKPYIIHGGSTEGYRSLLVNINDGELILVLLSNVGDRTDELTMAKELLNILIP